MNIREAEEALGIQFPPSYRWWLSVYGGGQIKHEIIYGIDEDKSGKPDIVQVNANIDISENGILVCDGDGESFFFDVSRKDQHGEYPIIYLEYGFDPEAYAVNFFEFLKKRIREQSNPKSS